MVGHDSRSNQRGLEKGALVMNFTDEQEARIRELYTPPYVRGLITQQAHEWGCKVGCITHRAKQLGLAKLSWNGSTRRWTGEEIRIIREHAHRTIQEVRRALADAGFLRSLHAIDCFRLRDGWRSRVERDGGNVGYSAIGLAQLMGVDPATVTRWIRQGLLKAKKEGGTASRCATYRIQPRGLRQFMTQHVHYWEPAKADKYWLIDVLTSK